MKKKFNFFLKIFTLNIAHLPISACVNSSNFGNSTSSEFHIFIFDTSNFAGFVVPPPPMTENELNNHSICPNLK